jgi:hypothetical protein
LQVRQDPAVNFRALGHRNARRRGIEFVEPCVVHEERIRVPQWNQDLPADFVGGFADHFAGGGPFECLTDRSLGSLERHRLVTMARPKAKVDRRVLRQVHPAHGIDADLFGSLFKPDRRAV